MKHKIMIVLAVLMATGFARQLGPDKDEIKMLKQWKMVEYLELNEEQGDIFFPKVRKLEGDLEATQKEIRALYQEIDRMVSDNNVDRDRLDDISRQIFALQHRKTDLIQQHFNEVADILTPEQLARYALFERKFKKLMAERFQQGNRRQPRKPRF